MRATSRSSSCSRRTDARCAARARSKGVSPSRRRAARASATTRSSFRRRGAHRRGARQRVEGELPSGPRGPRVLERSLTLPPPPVQLAAEDDHVRHHVQPEQEDRRAAERPQRHVDGRRGARRTAAPGTRPRARARLATAPGSASRSSPPCSAASGRWPAERRRRRRARHRRRGCRRRPGCPRSRRWCLSTVTPNAPTTRLTKSVVRTLAIRAAAIPFPWKKRRFGSP